MSGGISGRALRPDTGPRHATASRAGTGGGVAVAIAAPASATSTASAQPPANVPVRSRTQPVTAGPTIAPTQQMALKTPKAAPTAPAPSGSPSPPPGDPQV